ncbi:MAG: ISAs1 family transposase [Candidatus Binatia bacterium]
MPLFLEIFRSVPDPRAENVRYELIEVLFIAFVSVLCGARCCTEMAEFGESKQAFFRKFLELKHGIPSHDVFSAVFRRLNAKALEKAFRRFMQAFASALLPVTSSKVRRKIVAIDGKALKRAYDKGKSSAPRLMVSAFATGIRMTLTALEAKDGNEVEAALEILGLIDLKGSIVTGDALHCNRRMAKAVIAQGADYVFTLKGNQDSLLSDARARLAKEGKNAPVAETNDKGHGRIESRRAVVVGAEDLGEYHEFTGLKAFGYIESIREIDGKRQAETRFFALSKKFKPGELLHIVREHWQIENGQHWHLDVVLREDDMRTRKDHGPANIAVLRRLALNVVRADPSKGSLSAKIKRAGWNENFLLKLLGQTR